MSTSRVAERGVGGLPALAAVALVEGQTLLPRPRHHLQVARGVFRLAEVPDAVHPATAGVGHVEDLAHGVHGQVVLVGGAGAGGGRSARLTESKVGRQSQVRTCSL